MSVLFVVQFTRRTSISVVRHVIVLVSNLSINLIYTLSVRIVLLRVFGVGVVSDV
jgi:hypothetical protein